MNTLLQDLRYAARGLRRTPGFTLVAALVLALGLGANVSLFSVVHAVLLQPLPFPQPERLVELQQAKPGEPGGVSYPNLLDWRAGSSGLFEGVAAYAGASFALEGSGEAQRVAGAVVSADLFRVLGTPPLLGRTLRPEEDRLGGAAVRPVVLSHALWKRLYRESPSALGRVLRLDDQAFTVVGVMPEGFAFPLRGEPAELWVSVAVDAEPSVYGGTIPTSRGYMRYEAALARLRPGVTAAQAQGAMEGLAERIAREHPEFGSYTQVRVTPALERLVRPVRPALLLLFGAVGLVLLIGCVNVANLLLARATVRRREVAVRLALGAGRARVAQLLLCESLLLCLVGGVLGVLMAAWGVDALLAFAPPDVPRLGEVRLSGPVLAFALGMSLVTALVAGLVPALGSARTGLHEALQDAGRSATEGSRGQRLRGALVVAQTALALVLLVGAGLLVNSTVRLMRVDPGFRPHGLLSVALDLPASRYPMKSEQVSAFWEQLQERVRALPGVVGVSLAEALPLSGRDNGASVELEGAAKGVRQEAQLRFVGLDYFRTLGVGQVAGRDFGAQDDREGPAVAVVNEAFVRRFLADRSPLGRRVVLGWGGSGPKEIVGVVRDVHHQALGAPPQPEVYVPLRQFPLSSLTLLVRTEGEPLALVGGVRREVQALDAGLPLGAVRTVDAAIERTLVPQRFVTVLLGTFAGVALLLTLLGLASVMAYTVAQRTPISCVRTALGAQASDVLKLVLRQALRRTAVGLALGVVAALLLTRLLSGWLYEVSPTDPWTFVGVSLLLAVAAAVASYVPARKAANVSPLLALRGE